MENENLFSCMYLIYTFEHLLIYWCTVFILYALVICTCSRAANLNDKYWKIGSRFTQEDVDPPSLLVV